MSEGLKPCPFCGGNVDKHIAKNTSVQMFYCDRCLAVMVFRGHLEDPGATQAYNRRVNDGTQRT